MSKPTPRRIRLKTLDDVRRLLAATLNEYKGGVIDETNARTTGYLCKLLSELIRDSELEARLTVLEEQLNQGEKPWPV